ncbi:MAG: CSLREA domain-containing protein [Xanthomonadales bacterium]|nr:CSLREA domain-containing protein [Xanthomonadales bacterium]
MKPRLWNAALVLLLASSGLGATAIQVTTRNDQFGEDTTKCSLREAVQAANTDTAFGGCPAGSATDLITFDQFSNQPKLTRAGRDEDANATGDLDVSASGTIVFVGNSTGGTVIDGNGIDRVFDLDCRSDMNVQFNSLTIRGGDAGSGAGGGIYMCAHTASIYAVHMTENSASSVVHCTFRPHRSQGQSQSIAARSRAIARALRTEERSHTMATNCSS